MAAALAVVLPSAVQAQSVPFGIGDAVRSGEEARRPPLPRSSAAPVLPRLAEPQLILKDKETLRVRHFRIEGSILIPEAEIRAILAPYEGRKLTLAQIYEAADAITTLYRSRGYLLAKAYVPAQDARRGVLRIRIVAGRYGAITLKNESLVRDSFMHGMIGHAITSNAVVHKDALERLMLLMSDLPGAGVPRIAIGAGRQPETSDFVFDVPPRPLIDGYVTADNFGSPYTGRNRVSAGLNLNSPLGIGDRLSAFGIVSEHTDLVNGRVAYSLPLNYDGLRGEVAAFRTTYTLGGRYKDLDATGTADGVTASLTYALKRQRDDSIYLSGNYTYKALNDKVLSLSMADRTINSGTVAVTRDTQTALAGLPLLMNTTLSFTHGQVNFDDPAQKAANMAGVNTAGGFSKLNLLVNGTLAFNDKLSLTTTFRGQKALAGKNLDSSEQFSLTGVWGVRSFDEGLAGDSGYIVTPELKYALPDIYNYRHSVGLFTDIGAVWLSDPSYTITQQERTRLNDVGLGYYATYEYMAGRFLLLKAMVAHSYGSSSGAQTYDRGTKGLVQVGSTF